MILFGNDFISLLYMIPILLLSVAVHECSHATVAYKLGDRSQKLQGRMTLDPFAHMDLFGFIAILLIGFGWGKPVYVDDTNFKNKSRDNMLVSLAGPLSNLILAVVFTLVLKILIVTNLINLVYAVNIGSIIFNMFLLSIQFNVVFAVFNILPLPPLDGSKVLLHFLPYSARENFYNFEKYSFLILVALIMTGVINMIMDPFVNGITKLLTLFLNL